MRTEAVQVGPRIYFLPVDTEEDEVRLREGIARRRIMLTTGTCPCGAELSLAEVGAIGVLRRDGHTELRMAIACHHRAGCEAADPRLSRLMLEAGR